MVFYIIGLGLGDEKDITVRGLECVRKCKRVYLEHYTSILGVSAEKLSEFYGLAVEIADRNFVESEAENIYSDALNDNVGLLVVGDPLCATTHTDIVLRAKAVGVTVEIIHNVSVMAAVAQCGLQLYYFGSTVSIPYWEENWRPESFYDRLLYNSKGQMHTLCLLDIKVKEPDYSVMGKQQRFLPPRFMTVNEAIEQLLDIESRRLENVASADCMALGVARLGQPTQQIVYGRLAELRYVDFGAPLHCLVICAKELHPSEQEAVVQFAVTESNKRIAQSATAASWQEQESDEEAETSDR